MPATTVTVTRLVPDDWRVYREIRLAALAESPRMFGSDLAREQAFGEADWRPRADGVVVARDDGTVVGVAGRHWAVAGVRADLVAMWVSPAGRGLGIGAVLVRAVVDDVVRTHGAELELGVLVDNAPAIALYRREGFVDIGHETGIRSGDLLLRMRFARDTTTGGAA